jgi:hypothetical protein
VPASAKEAVVGDAADHGGLQIPLVEDSFDVRLASGLGDQQHALLRFRQQKIVRAHDLLAPWNAIQIDLDAESSPTRHLHRRAGEPRRSHVLDRHQAVAGHQLEARFEQQLLGERISHLYCRALLLGILIELGRCHARAVNAVAPRPGADIHHRVPNSRGGCTKDPVGPHQAEREGVDENVLVVAAVEVHLAADRRDSDAVPVSADARHHSLEELRRVRMPDRTEAQRIQVGDRPGAHREHVTQNPAYARRGALVRLDEGRVVVALDLENGGEPVTDVDHAGVLARSLENARSGGRQRSQVRARALVAAVLGPHGREHTELFQSRRTAEDGADLLPFVSR